MLKILNNLVKNLKNDGFSKEAGTIEELAKAILNEVSSSDEAGTEDEDSTADSKQLNFRGTSSQNFDICEGAVKAFKNLDEIISEDQTEDSLSAFKKIDELLGIEKAVLKDSKATDEQAKKAIKLASDAMYLVGTLGAGIETDLSESFSFINMHIEKIMEHKA